ncbi:unnamed protein product, partial [marine sediment metagenome]
DASKTKYGEAWIHVDDARAMAKALLEAADLADHGHGEDDTR